jgi:hypothetical protein
MISDKEQPKGVFVDFEGMTYPDVLAAIKILQKRERELYGPYMAEERRKAAIRSQQRAENQKKLEAKAIEDFGTLMVGDIVKVTGVRDSRYPYREVTGFHRGMTFTGWQIRQNKDGTFERGSQHTSHMANKIRGVAKRAELELVDKL